MKFGVYAVRDTLNGFGTLMCDHSDATASRSFKYAMNQEGSFPRDYDLYKIGTYDCDSGTVVSFEFPELVLRGIDCIPRDSTD